MPRYVAFLRGVSPTNLKMTDLKRCLESAGFSDVRTVLSSGNAVFTTRTGSDAAIERKIEKALAMQLGRTFQTLVRSVAMLKEMLDSDPYSDFRLSPQAKRVVTFLSEPLQTRPRLPLELDGARILAMRDREVFTAYVPSPRGPVFMTLIQKNFGESVTTRTWDTVRKCVSA